MAQADLTIPIGNIKTQINGAWEKSMYQTFMDEVGLLGGGGRMPRPAEPGAPAAH
jgi:hypothetical protein